MLSTTGLANIVFSTERLACSPPARVHLQTRPGHISRCRCRSWSSRPAQSHQPLLGHGWFTLPADPRSGCAPVRRHQRTPCQLAHSAIHLQARLYLSTVISHPGAVAFGSAKEPRGYRSQHGAQDVFACDGCGHPMQIVSQSSPCHLGGNWYVPCCTKDRHQREIEEETLWFVGFAPKVDLLLFIESRVQKPDDEGTRCYW